jgi:radical SAM-linked protein
LRVIVMTDEQLRLRVAYRKDGRLAYLGHLEVINTVERSIRRSGLPFAVGNGFAKRMKVQFSQALPVGAFSRGEYFDVVLTQPVETAQALDALRAASPTALGPYRAAYVQRRLPALEAWLNRAQWEVEVRGSDLDAAMLDRALAEVANEGRIDFMRGDKPRSIELASTLVSWTVRTSEQGVFLVIETRSSNLGALRPAILLDAAFGRPCMEGAVRSSQRVCRTGQWHEDDGRLVKPFDTTFVWSLT